MSKKTTVRELITKWGFKVDTKPLDRAQNSVNGLKDILKKVAAASAAVGVAIGGVLNEAGKYEQVNIAFTTMLKSAEKAKNLLIDIENFASSTPFELPTLQDGAKKLLAFGFGVKEIIGSLKDMGNIAAGVGMDKLPTIIAATGKIRVKGKASMEELNMMLEAGVPILGQLSKNLGITDEKLFKMISSGKITFKEVNKALHDLSNGSGLFAGMMAKQAKSFFGVVSNIKDNIGLLAKDIGMALLPEATKTGRALLDWYQANKKIIQSKFIEYIKLGVKFLSNMWFVISNIGDALYSVLKLFGGLEKILNVAITLFTVFLGLRFAHAIGASVQAVYALAKGFKIAGNSALLANAKAMAIPIAIGLAVMALGLAIEDIIGFFNGKDSVTGIIVEKFKEAFEWLEGKFSGLGRGWKILLNNMLLPLRLFLSSFRMFGTVIDTIKGKMSFSEMGSTMLGNLKDAFGGGDTLKGALGFGDDIAPNVKPSFMNDSTPNVRAMGGGVQNNIKQELKQEIIINKDMDENRVKELVSEGSENAMRNVFSGAKNNFSNAVAE